MTRISVIMVIEKLQHKKVLAIIVKLKLQYKYILTEDGGRGGGMVLLHLAHLAPSSPKPSIFWLSAFPVGNYVIKVNNRNTRTRCGICSKLTIKDSRTTPTQTPQIVPYFDVHNGKSCINSFFFKKKEKSDFYSWII